MTTSELEMHRRGVIGVTLGALSMAATVLRRKRELTPDTLAVSWRNNHAPLFAANDYLRRYFINLTDRTYAPDVPWDGYADIWWDDFASTALHSDARVPLPDSDSEEVMYMFMTPRVVT